MCYILGEVHYDNPVNFLTRFELVKHRNSSLGLRKAWHETDQAMYDCKKSHKGIIRL